MTRRLPLFALCFLVLCGASWSQVPTSQPVRRTLFTKEIASGQKIVITRDRIDPTRLGTLGADIAREKGAITLLRIDLHTSDGSALLLGATGHSEYPDFRADLEVLDVFAAKGELVVACSMGSHIGLWRVTLDRWGRPDGWTLTAPDQRMAVRMPLEPGSVKAEMSLAADRRWRLTLTRSNQTVEFEQVEDAWRFRQVNPPWPRP